VTRNRPGQEARVALWKALYEQGRADAFCNVLVRYHDPPDSLFYALGVKPRKLSAREREIAHLASVGWRDQNIAAALGISYYTVKSHWRRMMAAFGIEGRAYNSVRPYIVATAIRRGEI
jgi:DNA-binding NarL/FixJ family response regulator